MESEQDYYRSLQTGLPPSECFMYEACPRGRVALNLDGYSMEASRYPFIPHSIWAWRAILGAAMDVVAVGARPEVVMFSVGCPSRWCVEEVLQGATAAAQWMGAELGKNDTNTARPGGEWIDIAVLGWLPGRATPRFPPPPPAGAGLHVLQVGYAGYGLIERLAGEGRIGLGLEVLHWLVKRKPPIAAWRAIAECHPRASADNSDGYALTLANMARLGGLDIELVEPPLLDPRLERLEPLRGDPWRALWSWEDYNLLVLAGDGEIECLKRSLRSQRVSYRIVGHARRGRGRILVGGRPVGLEGWYGIPLV